VDDDDDGLSSSVTHEPLEADLTQTGSDGGLAGGTWAGGASAGFVIIPLMVEKAREKLHPIETS
jgi:hypothetical protein